MWLSFAEEKFFFSVKVTMYSISLRGKGREIHTVFLGSPAAENRRVAKLNEPARLACIGFGR